MDRDPARHPPTGTHRDPTPSDGVERMVAAIADPMVAMRRIVDEALLLIPAAEGAVVELADGDLLTYACAGGSLREHVGLRLNSADSLSGLAIRTRTTLMCADSTVDPRVDADACRRVGARSMICVPLQRQSEAVGVLKVSSATPNAFTHDDVTSLTRLAEFIGWVIATATDLAELISTLQAPPGERDGSPSGEAETHGSPAHARFVGNVLRPGLVSDTQSRDRIRAIIAASSIDMAFQPIVDLSQRWLVGAEALARFPHAPEQGPDLWFAEAHRLGLGLDLELVAVDRALALLERVPPGGYMAINASPQTVVAMSEAGILDGVDRDRIVVELTEHLEVSSYPELSDALAGLRQAGVRVAIDDTGSGFSTFAHILNLRPNIIKLDRILTTGIDVDPVRRALAGALTAFAADIGAQVVAEGIETAAELDTVAGLGICHGQGYYLGRPAPVRDLRRFETVKTSARMPNRPS